MIVAASQEKGPNECAARRAPRLTLQFMLFSDCLQSWNFALRIYGPIKSVCGLLLHQNYFRVGIIVFVDVEMLEDPS